MQKYISEFIGTFVLLVSIVGSGIAGQQYTNDQMVILVSHAVVIGLTLIFIIGIFANFSGAHFNPIVSILFFLQKELSKKDLCLFISIQITAAILGPIFANAGINPSTVIFFIGSQVISMFGAYFLYNRLFNTK